MTTNPDSLYPSVTQAATETVPLKAWMKARLLSECLPLVSFLILADLMFIFAGNLVAPSQMIIFTVFIAVVTLVLGYQALQRMRDLLSGEALVEDDVLDHSWASRQERIFWGKFEGLGRLRLMPKAHFGSSNGGRYRVTYSPISRIVWMLEKIS